MTTTDHTALVPALLYESLPKPSPYPFDEEPAPAKSRPRHPHLEINLRIPHYPGVAFQAPTPGYPSAPLGAQYKPSPRGKYHHPPRHARQSPAVIREPQPQAPQSPATGTHSRAQRPTDDHRTDALAGLTGHQIRDKLIHAAAAPPKVSLLHPTGEFAKKVDAVRRARAAEEGIPQDHLPTRRLALRLWRLLPALLLVVTCRHCGHAWPCRRLTSYLTQCHGPTIDWPLHRLSTTRRRKRAARRDPTTVTHRAKPRRIDKLEQQIQPTRKTR